MSWPRIEGLPGWRRKDGQVQQYDSDEVDIGYSSDPKELAKKCVAWSVAHDEPRVYITHKSFAQGDYDCEVVLRFTGYVNRTEDDVKKERKKLRDRQRQQEAERVAWLEEELKRAKRG